MSDESFLLVSLDEDKSKKLAQVLSNDTSRKILDLLSKEDLLTETYISNILKIPLSTTHYNLSLLLKTQLLNDDHFTYSKKGKKIIHYTLANKYVIIAPRKSNQLFKKLREFIPVVLFMGLISYTIQFFSKSKTAMLGTAGANARYYALDEMTVESAKVAMESDIAPMATNVIQSNSNYAMWFLVGSITALIVYFLWSQYNSKRK